MCDFCRWVTYEYGCCKPHDIPCPEKELDHEEIEKERFKDTDPIYKEENWNVPF